MRKYFLLLIMIVLCLGNVSCNVSTPDNYIIDQTITTEYGDIFRITCTDYQHKWIISHESGFCYRLQFYDKEEGILPISSDEKIRCYLVGNIIIYYDAETKKFVKFEGDLYSDSEMVPIVKSVLLKNNIILKEYLPFFIAEYENDTRKMLQSLIDGNFDELSEYGLSLDEKTIDSMKNTAQQYLK